MEVIVFCVSSTLIKKAHKFVLFYHAKLDVTLLSNHLLSSVCVDATRHMTE